MAEREDALGGLEAGPGSPPDLPLIIDQMQNQLDDLREIVELQQRQLAEQRERLSALEDR